VVRTHYTNLAMLGRQHLWLLGCSPLCDMKSCINSECVRLCTSERGASLFTIWLTLYKQVLLKAVHSAWKYILLFLSDYLTRRTIYLIQRSHNSLFLSYKTHMACQGENKDRQNTAFKVVISMNNTKQPAWFCHM